MREMTLTGRVLDAAEGQRLGLPHSSVGHRESLSLARKLARKIADKSRFSNYLMIHALPRVAEMGRGDGLFAESLAASMAQTTPGAREDLRAFLEEWNPKFR